MQGVGGSVWMVSEGAIQNGFKEAASEQRLAVR